MPTVTSIEHTLRPSTVRMAQCFACKEKLKEGGVGVISRWGSQGCYSKSWHPSCATGPIKKRILAKDATIMVVGGVTQTEMEAIRRRLKEEEEKKAEEIVTPSASMPARNISVEYTLRPSNGIMAQCIACKKKLLEGDIRIYSRKCTSGGKSRSWHLCCADPSARKRILAKDATIEVSVKGTEMEAIRRGLKEEEKKVEEVSTPSAKKPVKRPAKVFESDDDDGSSSEDDDAAPPPRKQPARQAALAKKAANPFESGGNSNSDSDEDEGDIKGVAAPATPPQDLPLAGAEAVLPAGPAPLPPEMMQAALRVQAAMMDVQKQMFGL